LHIRYFFDSVDEIKKEIKKYSMTAFLLGCFIMPIVVANADDAPNLDDFDEEALLKMESSPFIKMYSGPIFCRRIREILEDSDDNGVFESNAWKKYQKQANV